MRNKMPGGTAKHYQPGEPLDPWPQIAGSPRQSATGRPVPHQIEFDTSINRSDGSIAYLAISQRVSSGRVMRVVLNRVDLARMIARINGSLIYVNGEFQLAERPDKDELDRLNNVKR